MKRPALTYLKLFLALVILVTSQQMAIARGMPGAAGTMVICSGQGLVTITVDENGNPTGPVHICPDCAMSLFVAVGDVQAAPQLALRWIRVSHTREAVLDAGGEAPVAVARGPPLAV